LNVKPFLHKTQCCDISHELVEKFEVKINQVGLFEEFKNWQLVTDYMNKEKNGFEAVPWFICKVKLVNE
jgi:hypothetical protein